MRGTTHYKFHKSAIFLFVVAAVMLMSSSGAAAQPDEPEKPARPVNVRVVRQTDGSVTVAWDVPPGRPKADGYTVVYRLSAAEAGAHPAEARWWSFQDESRVGPDNRQARVRDLTNGAWYELTVTAQYGDDQWEWSDAVLARPGEAAPDVRPPAAPPATVTAEEPGSVTVAWEPHVVNAG